jgi:hypothetical protein
MIDITMTATRRHKLIKQTLSSFKQNLFHENCAGVIINIDPFGPDNGPGEVLSTVRKYFPLRAARMAVTANFATAFKWIWSQTTMEYIFHLEDDWELLMPVDLDKMLEIMGNNPDLAILRLPWKRTNTDSAKNWKYYFPWNGDFFECPEEHRREVGFCGHPSLIRGEFVRNIVNYISINKNPEKQFHHGHPEIMKEIDKWRYGVFAEQNQPPVIRDIGRKWMIENGYRKAGNKAFFTQWEEI